jgi:DNA-binding NarL/FixJ family response regulator
VVAAYEELGSMRKVAAALQMSTRTVLEDLRARGFDRYPSGQRPKRCGLDAQARRARVVVRYQQGDSAQAIADALGVAKGTVLNDLRAAGIDSRRVGRPAKYPEPEPRDCAYCGETFTPPRPCDGDQHTCSQSCRSRYRFRVAYDMPDGFAPLTAVVSGPSRQKWGGRRASRKAPAAGGLPRGRQPVRLTDEQLAEVTRLVARGWGRRAIAKHLLVSEWAVRAVLDP